MKKILLVALIAFLHFACNERKLGAEKSEPIIEFNQAWHFKDYIDNYDRDDHEGTYFGFLCNNLTGYDDTLSTQANVVLRGKSRPEVIPHGDQTDNEFVNDYYKGIDRNTADERIRESVILKICRTIHKQANTNDVARFILHLALLSYLAEDSYPSSNELIC